MNIWHFIIICNVVTIIANIVTIVTLMRMK